MRLDACGFGGQAPGGRSEPARPARFAWRVPVLLALVVAMLATAGACTSEPIPRPGTGPSATSPRSGSTAASTTASSGAGDDTTTTTTTSVRSNSSITAGPSSSAITAKDVELRLDGVGDVDFGADQRSAIDAFTGHFGAPDAGPKLEERSCGARTVRIVRWGRFAARFTEVGPASLFTSWSYGRVPDERTGEPGPDPGAPVLALRGDIAVLASPVPSDALADDLRDAFPAANLDAQPIEAGVSEAVWILQHDENKLDVYLRAAPDGIVIEQLHGYWVRSDLVC